MLYKKINGDPMTPEQIKAYLDRIDAQPPGSAKDLNLSYLTQLQRSHITHIPFENLDIMAGKPLTLDRSALFHKIILRNRGGVCSELNTLYNWLLESLGFDVTSYISRMIPADDSVQTESHRVMGVHLDEKIYLTDVGFNYEHHRIPLLLKEDLIQSDGECQYKLTRSPFWGWILWQERSGCGWRKKIGFTLQPHVDLDFVPATFFAQNHPDSKINKHTKVSLYIDGCFYAIRSNEFLREHSGIVEVIEPITSKEQEEKILKQVFHLYQGK